MKLKRKKVRTELRRWLRDSGQTQGEWAAMLNVHRMTVWAWLNKPEVQPHELAIKSIRLHSPGCPLLQEPRR